MVEQALSLFILLSAVAVGCYIQTVTGFAFGLIFLSVVSLSNIFNMPDASIMLAILTVGNTSIALTKEKHNASWRLVLLTLCTAIPMLFVGYAGLEYLTESTGRAIKLLLGGVILIASLLLLIPPKAHKQVSSPWSFSFFGALSGVLGGIFAINGPPLIYQFYRQNLPLVVIRDSLLTLFLILAFMRLLLVASVEGIHTGLLFNALIALPVAYLFTLLPKKFPPKISDKRLRQCTAVLLVLIAVAIVLQA